MKNIIHKFAIVTIAVSLAFSASAVAAEKKKEAAEPAAETTAAPADKAAKPLPFQVKVASVDTKAKTFTSKNKDGKENVFMITETSQIMKDDAAAKFSDIKVDEIVRGTRMKAGEGKWDVVKAMIGAKPEKPEGEKKMKKEKMKDKPDASAKVGDAATEGKKPE